MFQHQEMRLRRLRPVVVASKSLCVCFPLIQVRNRAKVASSFWSCRRRVALALQLVHRQRTLPLRVPLRLSPGSPQAGHFLVDAGLPMFQDQQYRA